MSFDVATSLPAVAAQDAAKRQPPRIGHTFGELCLIELTPEEHRQLTEPARRLQTSQAMALLGRSMLEYANG